MARDQRRLAAILAADVVGFTRMMEADEAETLARLKAARAEVLDPTIAEHGGRIVKTAGDGFLVEFGSAVDAVRCALRAQEAMATRNEPIAFRIGVSLGDIVVEDDDIFGDGVNLAARLEPLAPPGGVMIADNVHEQITGKINAAFADRGAQHLKNYSRAVRVWSWPPDAPAGGQETDGTPPRTAERTQNPLVLVMPFTAPAGDPDVEALSDGLADDLIAALAHRRGIRIVAHGAMAGLDRVGRDLAAIREATGADYVLTGSLRRSGARLRVSAELVETGANERVWGGRWDYEWSDVFEIEDTLTERIAGAIRPAMAAYDGRRTGDKPEDAMSNAERRAKAAQHFYKFSAESMAAAETLLDAAIAEDPDDATALAMQAFCLLMQGFFRPLKPDPETAERAWRLAERAVELDRGSDYAFETRGLLALHLHGDCEAALADARQSRAIDPQYVLAIQLEADALIYAGRPEEGIPLLEKLIALDPNDPTNFFRHWVLAIGLFVAGRDAEAVNEVRTALRGAFEMPMQALTEIVILERAGRHDDATDAAARFCERWPEATLDTVRLPPFQRADDRERFRAALRAAGLPEGSG